MEEDWIKVTRKYKHVCHATSSQLPPSLPSHSSSYIIAKGDSAASKHYFTEQDKHILVKVRFDSTGPTVLLPNSAFLTAQESGELPIGDMLSKLAKKTAIFQHLHSSLISLGQLCDDECIVILGKHLLEVIKNGIWNQYVQGKGHS